MSKCPNKVNNCCSPNTYIRIYLRTYGNTYIHTYICTYMLTLGLNKWHSSVIKGEVDFAIIMYSSCIYSSEYNGYLHALSVCACVWCVCACVSVCV